MYTCSQKEISVSIYHLSLLLLLLSISTGNHISKRKLSTSASTDRTASSLSDKLPSEIRTFCFSCCLPSSMCKTPEFMHGHPAEICLTTQSVHECFWRSCKGHLCKCAVYICLLGIMLGHTETHKVVSSEANGARWSFAVLQLHCPYYRASSLKTSLV